MNGIKKALVLSITISMGLMFPQCRAMSAERLISVSEHIDYKERVKPALEVFAKKFGKTKTNHFFVERVSPARLTSSSEKCPWIFWQEGKELILFEPYRNGNPFDELIYSRRKLSLNKDVLPKRFNGINTSTYMLRFEEAQKIKKDCLHGTEFTISR